MVENLLEQYFSVIIDNGGYTTKKNLKYFVRRIFEGIDFENKNVLEIGGGFGLLSFYAACNGANHVINLEPDLDGHSGNSYRKFQEVKQGLPSLQNIQFEASTFQDFKNNDLKFDVIILYNSINHLNEEACIHLCNNPEAEQTYHEIFAKMGAMTNTGAQLVLCDCSNYNFFNLIKFTNPFVPSIEWHKHQSPKVWSVLLEKHTYANPKTYWSSPNTLGPIGKFLFSNKIASYFMFSHFCLKMEYKGIAMEHTSNGEAIEEPSAV